MNVTPLSLGDINQGIDNVTQSAERLVDVAGLLQGLATCSSKLLTLTTSQINDVKSEKRRNKLHRDENIIEYFEYFID